MEGGKIKLYYFDLFGRAEPTRMCLAKAGVEYEDIRVTGDSWKELKESGKLEFGQIPHVELADGTTMSQSMPILNYFGAKHGLKPQDVMANYRGEKAVEHLMGDFVMKHLMKVFFAEEDKKAGMLDEMVAEGGSFEKILDSLSSKCLGDSKFLCGETTTIHDFCVAGWFTNVVLNPN